MNYSIIMSAGDSITAGLGARWSYTSAPVFVVEDCRVSFATGGDDDIVFGAVGGEKWGGELKANRMAVGGLICIDRPANSKDMIQYTN